MIDEPCMEHNRNILYMHGERSSYTVNAMKKNRKCNTCGKRFEPNRDWQKFCSEKCRDTYHSGRRREAANLLAGRQYERVGGKEDDKAMLEMWNDFCLFIGKHKDVLFKLLPKE